MDEPTSALDPISTLKIEDLMEDLKKKYTVVVVTHNMPVSYTHLSCGFSGMRWEYRLET